MEHSWYVSSICGCLSKKTQLSHYSVSYHTYVIWSCPHLNQIDYKQFPGFYPHAAGMIASHGPYNTVSDIYKIPGITANDKAIFKKYEKELTVLPPGRMFKER